MLSGNQPGALASWRALVDLPRLLFAEPSPAPIKHWLWRRGLIDSPEVRLPMTSVSDALAAQIDREIGRRGGEARIAVSEVMLRVARLLRANPESHHSRQSNWIPGSASFACDPRMTH